MDPGPGTLKWVVVSNDAGMVWWYRVPDTDPAPAPDPPLTRQPGPEPEPEPEAG